jgi:hypothetical protein
LGELDGVAQRVGGGESGGDRRLIDDGKFHLALNVDYCFDDTDDSTVDANFLMPLPRLRRRRHPHAGRGRAATFMSPRG